MSENNIGENGEDGGRAIEYVEVLGIEKCARCGKTGDDGERYSVRGVARIGGNLCVECFEELHAENRGEVGAE